MQFAAVNTICPKCANRGITIQNGALTLTQGNAGTYQIVAVGGTGIIYGGTFPTGVTVNTSTGLVSVADTLSPDIYSIPISAFNGRATANGTLTLTVNAPPITLSLSTTIFSNLDSLGTFEISIDGGSYANVSSPATYNPTSQIKYRLTLPTSTYGLVELDNFVGVGGNIITSAPFTLKSGSTLTLNGQVSGGNPLGLFNEITQPPGTGFSELGSGTLGPYNLSSDLSGVILTSGEFSMGAETQFSLISTVSVVMETILNF